MGKGTESARPGLSLDFSKGRRNPGHGDPLVGFSEGFGDLRIVKRKAK